MFLRSNCKKLCTSQRTSTNPDDLKGPTIDRNDLLLNNRLQRLDIPATHRLICTSAWQLLTESSVCNGRGVAIKFRVENDTRNCNTLKEHRRYEVDVEACYRCSIPEGIDTSLQNLGGLHSYIWMPTHPSAPSTIGMITRQEDHGNTVPPNIRPMIKEHR